MLVKINTILIPEGRRPLRNIQAFAQSIQEIGLLNPILITEDSRLIAGYHRLEACKSLGWEEIEANIINMNELDRELAEIDENLIRNELTELERDEHLLRRKEIHEIKYPETKQGIAGGKAGGRGREKIANEIISFAIDTAAKTNLSPRTVQQGIQIARDIVSDVKNVIRDTSLADSKVELLKLSRMKPEEQRKIAEKISSLDGEKTLSQVKTEIRREERVEQINKISQSNTPLALDRTYPVIYADPPWKYDFSPTESRAIENQYPTMDLEEICSLPVAGIAAEDCVLFLWATAPKLSEALQVIHAWGFVYKTCMVWVKDKIGMGYYVRNQHELLLIATRGNLPTPAPENRPSSAIFAPRQEHSQKPAVCYEIIERMYPEYARIELELFQRTPREGWAAWGNQA